VGGVTTTMVHRNLTLFYSHLVQLQQQAYQYPLTWYRKSKCWCLLLLFFESCAQVCTTKNIIGKVTRIDEPKGAWLTHHYDSIGNLIKTVVGGVTTTMEYDIRGNKTKMNDPDMRE
jgi:YD repeat-containing protein